MIEENVYGRRGKWRRGYCTSGVQRKRKHIFVFSEEIIQCKHMYKRKKKRLQRKAERWVENFHYSWPFSLIHSFILYRVHIIGNVFVVAIFYAWNLLRSVMLRLAWDIHKQQQKKLKERKEAFISSIVYKEA